MPLGTTDWSLIQPSEHQAKPAALSGAPVISATSESGSSSWCTKGHILFCLEGELHTALEDGRNFILKPGMSYQVADNAEPHRSSTATGAKLFVLD